jgi:hypothetical protein
MRKFVLLCASLFTMVLLFLAGPARAQIQIAYLAHNGGSAPCGSLSSPCGDFTQVFASFTQGPQFTKIICLDSGDYGFGFTITASLEIECSAGVGDVEVVNANPGITINAGTGATIILRHLSMSGPLGGAIGINVTSLPNGKLIVEDCAIANFSGAGINFAPSSGRATLEVSNTRVTSSAQGINVQPASGVIASVTLDHVALNGNSANGLVLGGAGVVAGAMRNSVASSNTTDGVLANAGQVYFTVESSSLIANLANGVRTNSAGSNLNLTASTVSGNGTGVLASAGSLISFGNNTLNGNAVDGTFTSTTALK